MASHPIANLRSYSSQQRGISYSQSDIDTIRDQIQQLEASKRHWLLLGFIIALAAFVGAVFLLGNTHRLYSVSESRQDQLKAENASLRASLEQTKRDLDTATAVLEKQRQDAAQRETRFQNLLRPVLNGGARATDIGEFARMVSSLPSARIELGSKPPQSLFRNWKFTDGRTTETYTLVGGFVDGKWAVTSNLIARRSATD